MRNYTRLGHKPIIHLAINFSLAAACSPALLSSLFEGKSMALDEPYRPQYHFTPPTQWRNDPNDLLYYDGEYHLLYHYNPNGTVWGPMHWGHAVSTELINWQHLLIALYPDENGAIFSGTAVTDWHNTSGFGKEALVAVFTHAKDNRQSQNLAYSVDNLDIYSLDSIKITPAEVTGENEDG